MKVIGTISDQCAFLLRYREVRDHRQALLHRSIDQRLSLQESKRAGLNDKNSCPVSLHLRNNTVHSGKVGYASDWKFSPSGVGCRLGRSMWVMPIRQSRIPKVINSGGSRFA